MNTFFRLRPVFLRYFAGLSAFAVAFTADAADVTSADQAFVREAYQNGLAEVRLGELGKDKTANADLKAFAERLVAEHGKANAELKTLAETKGLSLTSTPGVATLAQVKILDGKAGAEFDRTFAAVAVRDHQNAVTAFEKAGNTTKDSEVRAYITKTLPTLKEHLTLAQSLQEKVGN